MDTGRLSATKDGISIPILGQVLISPAGQWLCQCGNAFCDGTGRFDCIDHRDADRLKLRSSFQKQ
jgi:hypothetical protein